MSDDNVRELGFGKHEGVTLSAKLFHLVVRHVDFMTEHHIICCFALFPLPPPPPSRETYLLFSSATQMSTAGEKCYSRNRRLPSSCSKKRFTAGCSSIRILLLFPTSLWLARRMNAARSNSVRTRQWIGWTSSENLKLAFATASGIAPRARE